MSEHPVMLSRTVIRQVMDALESDADIDLRRAAFEAVQDACEPVTTMPLLEVGDWVRFGFWLLREVTADNALQFALKEHVLEVRKANGVHWRR